MTCKRVKEKTKHAKFVMVFVGYKHKDGLEAIGAMVKGTSEQRITLAFLSFSLDDDSYFQRAETFWKDSITICEMPDEATTRKLHMKFCMLAEIKNRKRDELYKEFEKKWKCENEKLNKQLKAKLLDDLKKLAVKKSD